MLCQQCQGKMFLMAMGVCQECKGVTTSMSYKYCESCSQRRNQCQACGKSMP
jgi:hypothetical protein